MKANDADILSLDGDCSSQRDVVLTLRGMDAKCSHQIYAAHFHCPQPVVSKVLCSGEREREREKEREKKRERKRERGEGERKRERGKGERKR